MALQCWKVARVICCDPTHAITLFSLCGSEWLERAEEELRGIDEPSAADEMSLADEPSAAEVEETGGQTAPRTGVCALLGNWPTRHKHASVVAPRIALLYRLDCPYERSICNLILTDGTSMCDLGVAQFARVHSRSHERAHQRA
jgi:hypothetical protein